MTTKPDRPISEDEERTDTGTGTARETGTDIEDAKKAGMRPTGSGGSAPPSENR